MPEILTFNFSSLSQAPEGPGIYAWYAHLSVGPADFLRDLIGEAGLDRGEQRLRDLLARHSRKFVPPPLSVKAKASFQSSFTGELTSTLEMTVEAELAPQSEDVIEHNGQAATGGREDLSAALRTQGMRKGLVELLEQATPLFAAPIYIGTSRRLRERLAEHQKELEQLDAAIAADPSIRNKMSQIVRERKSTFAVRATALGFSPDQLTVRVLDAKENLSGTYSDRQLERLANAAEWLLNRWHRPVAGRL